MLYRGSEVMREVAWVIFDEIHYMRDSGIFCCVEMYVPCVFLKNGMKNFALEKLLGWWTWGKLGRQGMKTPRPVPHTCHMYSIWLFICIHYCKPINLKKKIALIFHGLEV